MAPFDVPGWNMPKEIKQSGDTKSRKRKRGASDESSSRFRLQTAEVNMEKLMEKLIEVRDAKKKDRRKPEGARGLGKKKKATKSLHAEAGQAKSLRPSSHEPTEDRSNRKEKNKKTNKASSSSHGQAQSVEVVSSDQTNPRNKEYSKTNSDKAGATKPDGASVNRQPPISSEGSNAKLTSLQSKMKQGLDGARFRWINETLYKSDSQEAERLMQDPKVFEDYHTGFRHQVISWPTNPVDHFIKTLSSCPERYVIVDLGCGDAVLARNLVPAGYTVLSFDLISANAFIVAADICRRLPLPGSESAEECQVVDIVVCCLSLMNTNWLNCIREARRILKRGGELKIAEVASRFTDIDKFTSVICSVGFRLVSKDERNTHFTLFDFKKAEGLRNLDNKVWQKALARADVLQPCEYKRR